MNLFAIILINCHYCLGYSLYIQRHHHYHHDNSSTTTIIFTTTYLPTYQHYIAVTNKLPTFNHLWKPSASSPRWMNSSLPPARSLLSFLPIPKRPRFSSPRRPDRHTYPRTSRIGVSPEISIEIILRTDFYLRNNTYTVTRIAQRSISVGKNFFDFI